jgi:hypothetical protein
VFDSRELETSPIVRGLLWLAAGRLDFVKGLERKWRGDFGGSPEKVFGPP